MSHQANLQYRGTGRASGILLDGDELVAEIRDLRLCKIRLRPGGEQLVGDDVPLPLYWEQYANHQHPERNAGSRGEVRCLSLQSNQLTLECTGESYSGEVLSKYIVKVSFQEETRSYVFDVEADLSVARGKSWLVTRNESHGELEFCNLWPLRTFVPGGNKQYQNCFVETKTGVYRIPHHHLETSDKHNIAMGKGDRFFWLLEDENPVVEILSSTNVCAGLCAYMWDAHFALRVCDDENEVKLNDSSGFHSAFRLSSITRAEGKRIQDAAVTTNVPEIGTTPIYVQGLNSFTEIPEQSISSDVWPWEQESEGGAECGLDDEIGRSDQRSLRIESHADAKGIWKVTTLGPAFGEESFNDGRRYRLSGFVRTRNLVGTARIGLRLHREGKGDVFNIDNYETFYGVDSASGDTDWKHIEVTSPLISPAPDRVHLLLEQTGSGTSWFDDILFERNV